MYGWNTPYTAVTNGDPGLPALQANASGPKKTAATCSAIRTLSSPFSQTFSAGPGVPIGGCDSGSAAPLRFVLLSDIVARRFTWQTFCLGPAREVGTAHSERTEGQRRSPNWEGSELTIIRRRVYSDFRSQALNLDLEAEHSRTCFAPRPGSRSVRRYRPSFASGGVTRRNGDSGSSGCCQEAGRLSTGLSSRLTLRIAMVCRV